MTKYAHTQPNDYVPRVYPVDYLECVRRYADHQHARATYWRRAFWCAAAAWAILAAVGTALVMSGGCL